jgi:hypothetical protein
VEGIFDRRPFEITIRALQAAIASGPQGELRGKVPRRVLRALSRGLSAEPDDRFDSMNELLRELAPVSRRHWILASLATAGVCTAAFALAFSAARTTESDVCSSTRDAIDATWNEARRAETLAAFARGEPVRGSADGRSVVQALDLWADAHSLARYDACTATHLRHEQSEQAVVSVASSERVGSRSTAGPELVKGEPRTLALAPTHWRSFR